MLEEKLHQQRESSSTYLNLSKTSIQTDRDAKKVAHWTNENQPHTVDLSDCDLTSKTLRVISQSLRKNTKLKLLQLQNNNIDASGCGMLSDILRKNTSIQSLNLLGNHICPDDSPSHAKNLNSSKDEDEEEESEIQDFVETCNEMQNIRSICGCLEFQEQEVTLFTDALKTLPSSSTASGERTHTDCVHVHLFQLALCGEACICGDLLMSFDVC